MKRTLLFILLFFSFLSYSQETYIIGRTEYYADKYYSTTGFQMVKRSEANKMEFLKSRGFKEIPKGFEVDHIKPLSEGGTDDPSNMQLLTIEQHKRKTARERANHSNSTYPLNRSYTTTSTSNIEEISTQSYSRTDSEGRAIYKGKNGGEYYVNSNGNKTYVKTESSTNTSSSSYYSAPSYTTPSRSREIQTGPRGGTYYINSNGNKTYTKSK